MHTYTVILEYLGGTYISQVSGTSAQQAVRKWIEGAPESDLSIWSITRDELATVSSNAPSPIEGLSNVWCTSGTTNEGLILVHVVSTTTASTEEMSKV